MSGTVATHIPLRRKVHKFLTFGANANADITKQDWAETNIGDILRPSDTSLLQSASVFSRAEPTLVEKAYRLGGLSDWNLNNMLLNQ